MSKVYTGHTLEQLLRVSFVKKNLCMIVAYFVQLLHVRDG